VGATEHLSLGFNVAIAKPMVFAPVLIGGIISILIARAGEAKFTLGLLSLVGFFITFILNFAAIDMARDAYVDDPLDLGRSFSYALGRLGTFILASIVGVVMFVTIILIPVAILMFVIIVVDETGITDAASKAFSTLGRDLGDVIVILIVAVVGNVLLALVPFLGGLLTACFGVILNLAFIDVYYRYRGGPL